VSLSTGKKKKLGSTYIIYLALEFLVTIQLI